MGRIWRRNVDDVLQNNPNSKSTQPRSTPVEEAAQASSVENKSPQPEMPAQSSALLQKMQDWERHVPPTLASPGLRGTKRTSKPPQRLIKQI